MNYFKLLSFLSIGLFTSLCISSCGGVDDLIKKSLKDDSTISKEEFTAIQDELKGKDTDAVKAYILNLAEKLCRRKIITCPIKIEGQNTDSSSIPTNNQLIFDFFYENSGSMDGYINGTSQFTDAVLSLMTKTKLDRNIVNLYYVSKDVYPLQGKITEFSEFLKPNNVRQFGKRDNSDINRILTIAIDSAITKKERATVLISDYIYSMKGKKVEDELISLKYSTSLIVDKLAQKGYVTLVVKIDSDFKGTYYTSTNKSEAVSEVRPVYLWFFGTNQVIAKVVNQFGIKNLSGYNKHIVLMNDNTSVPYYTMLNYTGKIGTFNKGDKSVPIIKDIKGIDLDRNGSFGAGVAFDASALPIMEDDILNPANYEVVSTTNNNFSIAKIEPIKNIENNDRKLAGSATHILHLSLNEKVKSGKQTINIRFKKQIPNWVGEASTNNDNSPEGRKGKTFGLDALVKGASAAYKYTDKSIYFSLPININN